MNENISPELIHESYKAGKYSKKTSSDLLISLIEESPKDDDRTNSLSFLGEIGLKTQKIHSLVENLMISDTNEAIRSIAVRIIFSNFLEKSINSLSWLIHNENSHKVVGTIVREIYTHKLYSKLLLNLLIKRFSKIFKVIPEESKFFVDLYKFGFKIDIRPNKAKKFKSGYQIQFPLFGMLYSPINYVKNGRVISLWLSNTNLSKLPERIGNLKKLKYLYLDNNKLKMLPKSIESLTRLKSLSLFGNNIKELPASIGTLRKLKYLDVKETSLTGTPNLLKKLALRNHAMRYIAEGVLPKEAVVLGLIQLISKIKLKKISQYDDIHNYDFHHSLYYYKINDSGHITGIYLYNFETPYLGLFPEQICNLEFLEELYLSNNDIQHIPNSIGTLSSLRELDLSWNKIYKFPETFTLLRNLKFLDISHNDIKDIPEIFNKFPSMEFLDYSGNGIKEIPRIILERNEKNCNSYKRYSK